MITINKEVYTRAGFSSENSTVLTPGNIGRWNSIPGEFGANASSLVEIKTYPYCENATALTPFELNRYRTVDVYYNYTVENNDKVWEDDFNLLTYTPTQTNTMNQDKEFMVLPDQYLQVPNYAGSSLFYQMYNQN